VLRKHAGSREKHPESGLSAEHSGAKHMSNRTDVRSSTTRTRIDIDIPSKFLLVRFTVPRGDASSGLPMLPLQCSSTLSSISVTP
jgi:hypothetical protein